MATIETCPMCDMYGEITTKGLSEVYVYLGAGVMTEPVEGYLCRWCLEACGDELPPQSYEEWEKEAFKATYPLSE